MEADEDGPPSETDDSAPDSDEAKFQHIDDKDLGALKHEERRTPAQHSDDFCNGVESHYKVLRKLTDDIPVLIVDGFMQLFPIAKEGGKIFMVTLVESLTCLGGHFQGNARMLFWSCF